MFVKVINRKLNMYLPNELLRSELRVISTQIPDVISDEMALKIGDSFITCSTGWSFHSIISNSTAVKHLFGFMGQYSRPLPTEPFEMRVFLADSMKYILSNNFPKKPSPERRLYNWNRYTNLIKQLMLDRKIPATEFPPTKLPRQAECDDASNNGMLGETLVELPVPVTPDEIWPDCYLGTPSYLEPSDAFLTSIEKKLKYLSETTDHVVEEFWTTRSNFYKQCRERIDAISPAWAAELLKSFNNETINYFPPEINPETEEGLINLLAILKYMLVNHDDIHSIGWGAFAKSSPRLAFTAYLQGKINTALQIYTGHKPRKNMKSDRFLKMAMGLPSKTDYAAAMVLLIHDTPKFNPMSLEEAKLTDKHGKKYLIARTESSERKFSVEKPRARTRKKAILSDRSILILEEIIAQTDILRAKLLKAKHPASHSLFIEISKFTINQVMRCTSEFSEPNFSLWSAIEGRLVPAGISRSNFSLSSIRNTEGILEWFRTGSVRMMAKKMGNKERTVLKSYMPPWILRRQFERIARAFQQKLIILANIECPWILEASDFNIKEDLRKFIFNALLRPNGSDQFTNLMESEFRAKFPEDFEPFENLKAKFLHLNLCPESLAALRIHLKLEDSGTSTADEAAQKITIDREISLHDLQLIARMLQMAVETPATTAAERSIRTNLQGNSFEELKNNWDKSSLLMQTWQSNGVHPRVMP